MTTRRGLRSYVGLSTNEGRERWDERLSILVGILAASIIVATGVGATFMLWRIYTRGALPAPGNPLTIIFSSRLMLAAARLAILFIGVYIVLSVLMHMRRGQWLTAAGPFKVSESIARVTTTLSTREEQLRQSLLEQQRLKGTVSELTREVRTLESLLARAREQLQKKDTT